MFRFAQHDTLEVTMLLLQFLWNLDVDDW